MEGEEVEMEEVEVEESDTEDEIEESDESDTENEIIEDFEQVNYSETVGSESEDSEEEEEDDITEEFVRNIKTIKALVTVIQTKNLGIRAGGSIHIKDVKSKTFEQYKAKVIDLLFCKGKEEDD